MWNKELKNENWRILKWERRIQNKNLKVKIVDFKCKKLRV